jgi:hypothetical protein
MNNALPVEWIDRLFMRLAAMYGNKFTKMWDGIPRQDQINTWAEMLGDMDKNDLSIGLKNCISQPYPPTLPEFRLLCVPKYEPERVFNVGIELKIKRSANIAGYKQNPSDWIMPYCDLSPVVIYWACSKLDWAYSNAHYRDFKNVWISILSECIQNRKSLEPIPEHIPHLLPKYDNVMSKEESKKRFQELREFLK